MEPWWLLTAWLVLLPSCGAASKPPAYESQEGLRITPPPGWTERIRAESLTDNAAQEKMLKQGRQDLPLPRIGGPLQERLLVQYNRLQVNNKAWLRVTVAELSEATPLSQCLTGRMPKPWKPESEPEAMEVNGSPAARQAYTGRWNDIDYAVETVAVRRGPRVFLITASFPSADAEAKTQVRKSVEGVVLPGP